MGVRQFAIDDIPQVAALWWKVLRRRKDPPPPLLLSFFRDLYFDNPLVDSRMPSLVYQDKGGQIVGFLGVVRRRIMFCGQPIRVAFGGNFVVEPKSRNSLGGLRLLADFMAGDQDLSQTDSANDKSKVLLERLGFRTIMPLSIQWARPLRPFKYAVHGACTMAGPTLSTCLKYGSMPLVSLADTLATKLRASPFRQKESPLRAENLEIATQLQCLEKFRTNHSLRPEYDAELLTWLLNFMERMHPRAILRRILLRDDLGNIIGWYIYYVKPGSVGQVVQVGGQPESINNVLQHLFRDACQHNVIALHGSVLCELMADYSRSNCFFMCRDCWTVAHSRSPELLSVLRHGDASLTRLDGEWCLNFDD